MVFVQRNVVIRKRVAMYERGDRVIVQGRGGGPVVLRVWEDHGKGVAVSSEAGYHRLLAGEDDAPLVGFPRSDVRGPAPTEDSTNGRVQPITR